jgi:hypothetical protein
MPQMSYVFGDLLTGEIGVEINNAQGVSIVETLEDGELRCTLHLDETGRDNDSVVSSTIPGRCYVIAEREGRPVFGGIVWSRTYQSQAKSLQLYCKGFKGYPERRFITTDINTSLDQITTFLNLYTTMQSDPNSIQVALPASFSTGTIIDLDVKGSELKTYRQVIDSFADTTTGFDWIIVTSRVGGTYSRDLRIGYPTIGSPVNHGTVTFDYPGNITNYWKTDSMSASGTHIYGVGSGEGDSALISTAVDTEGISFGFPRYDHSISFKDINDLPMLSRRVTQELELRRPTAPIFTLEVKGDKDPQFGDYGLGDACRIHIVDPMHMTGYIKTTRVLGWEYYPASDDSIELVRLIFEGDPEAE